MALRVNGVRDHRTLKLFSSKIRAISLRSKLADHIVWRLKQFSIMGKSFDE